MTNKTILCAKLAGLAKELCQRMVARPQDVEVTAEAGGTLINIEIATNAADGRRIVGKGGSRFRAIWTLLRRAARKDGAAVGMERVRDLEKPSEEFPPYQFRPDWDAGGVVMFADKLAEMVLDGPVDVDIENGDHSAKLIIQHCDDGNLLETARALNCVFEAIGTVAGCYLSVDLKRFERV